MHPAPHFLPMTSETLVFTAAAEHAGDRLDKWIVLVAPDLSRSRAQALINEGRLTVNGEVVTDVKHKVRSGGLYTLALPEPVDAEPQPEDIPLDILFEDEHLIVINKQAGLVVHPAPGTPSGTLVNALLHHCAGSLSGIGGVARPGIVHRLDKDTSGVMVAAKSEPAHNGLAALFEVHLIERAYLAVTRGAPRPLIGRVENRIARSESDRKKMAVVKERVSRIQRGFEDEDDSYERPPKGRVAVTNYKVLEQFGKVDSTSGLPAATLTECRLETGRTHQIRVHMAHLGSPILGDPTYGKFRGLKVHGSGPAIDAAQEASRGFRRQALHAALLGFEHPVTGETQSFTSEPPADMQDLLSALRNIP